MAVFLKYLPAILKVASFLLGLYGAGNYGILKQAGSGTWLQHLTWAIPITAGAGLLAAGQRMDSKRVSAVHTELAAAKAVDQTNFLDATFGDLTAELARRHDHKGLAICVSLSEHLGNSEDK